MSPRARGFVILLSSLLGLVVTVSACLWQLDRGRTKDRLVADMAAARNGAPIALSSHRLPESALRYRHATAKGEFVSGTTILMDNQPRGPQPGYLVYTALKLAGGGHVVVKRGWVAGSPDRSVLPEVRTPSGELDIDGIALPPPAKFFELGTVSLGEAVWPHITVSRYEERFGLGFQPIVLEQHSDTGDGLVREWQTPSETGSAKNYGYALQWGGMALLIVGLNVYYGIRRFKASRSA